MSIIALLISLIVWALIFWLVWWFVGFVALPEPFNKVIMVLLALAAILVIIGLLIGSVPPFVFLSGLHA